MKGKGIKVCTTEAQVEELFGVVFAPLSFSDEDVAWMKEYLLNEHHEKQEGPKKQMKAHQHR
jgi:hypothetical protein